MFLKEFFEKVNFEKKSADSKKITNKYPACNDLNGYVSVQKGLKWVCFVRMSENHGTLLLKDYSHFIMSQEYFIYSRNEPTHRILVLIV